jgi:hypothetical protein
MKFHSQGSQIKIETIKTNQMMSHKLRERVIIIFIIHLCDHPFILPLNFLLPLAKENDNDLIPFEYYEG